MSRHRVSFDRSVLVGRGTMSDSVQIVTGAALVGAIIYLGKKVVENWLDKQVKSQLQAEINIYSRELEQLKGSILKDIENSKGKINLHADRQTRLHQLEFETLPRLWELLCKSVILSNQADLAFEEHPDLSTMPDDHVQDFAASQGLSKRAIEAIVSSKNRNDLYIKSMNNLKHYRASVAIWKLRTFNFRNSIIWPPEISLEIDSILSDLTMFLILSRMRDRPSDQNFKQYMALNQGFSGFDAQRLKTVKGLIKDRLNFRLIESANSTGNDTYPK